MTTDNAKPGELMPFYLVTTEHNEYQTTLEIRERIKHDGKEAYRFVTEFDGADRQLAKAAVNAWNEARAPQSPPVQSDANYVFMPALEYAAEKEREAVQRIAFLDPKMPAEQLRLHMGELTADEVRVARAAIKWANTHHAASEKKS